MDRLPDRLRPRPVAAFVVLTLLIWTNRIWLAWTNPDDTVVEKLVWSTPITLFVLASGYLLSQMLLDRTDRRGFVPTVRVFAAGTVVYWMVRLSIIVAGDHAVGFKVVHGVLAAVSAAAAVWAWRSVVGEQPDAAVRRDGEPVGAAG